MLHRASALFSTLLLLSFISCKKNDQQDDPPADTWNTGQQCAVANSLPSEMESTNTAGGVTRYRYEYDASHRIVREYRGDTLETQHWYYGYDRAWALTFGSGLYDNELVLRTFNASGDHLTTQRWNISKVTGDTSREETFTATYNSAHEIQTEDEYYAGVTGPTDTSYVYRNRYTWENGNLVRSDNLLSGTATLNEYLPGTDGRFKHNVPGFVSGHMYKTTASPVSSKEIIAKYNYNGTVYTYQYTFDASGRVATMTWPNGVVYRFRYQCY